MGGGATKDEDEMLFYLKEYYADWLDSTIKYYFFEEGGDESKMSDEFWTGLAKNYFKYIEFFPFLKRIGFNGATLGVGVSREELVEEYMKIKEGVSGATNNTNI
jgi:hypothetical protein